MGKQYEIQVTQSDYKWTIDTAPTRTQANLLAEHYRGTEHYESVDVVDSLEIRE